LVYLHKVAKFKKQKYKNAVLGLPAFSVGVPTFLAGQPPKKWSRFSLQSFYRQKGLKKVFSLQSLTQNELRFMIFDLRF